MKKILMMAAIVGVAMSSCGTSKQETASDAENESGVVAAANSIEGKWSLESIVVNDTLTVRPSEVEEGNPQYLIFMPDSMVSIQTNCNIVNGGYVVSGQDSISFGNLASTRMYCPDMDVETYIGVVFPEVKTYEFTNDTTLRLNTSVPTQYVVLTRSAE